MALCTPLAQEAGYDEAAQTLIRDVMMSRNLPDPRDIRKYDVIGALGMVDWRTLRVREGDDTPLQSAVQR
jgi:hypothetical protein